MSLLEDVNELERAAILRVAADEPIDLTEEAWESSPLLAAVSAVEAIDQAWESSRTVRLQRILRGHMKDCDGELLAAVATRLGMLELWWESDAETARRVLPTARVAAGAAPYWVLNHLLLFDCLLLTGQHGEARQVAEELQLVPGVTGASDSLERAVEYMFTGRLGWTVERALAVREAVEL